MSPFFGALYLKPLDLAFEDNKNYLYQRYMDDIIILAKDKRSFQRARKRVFMHLKALKLKCSPHKTKMGKLAKGFHYLGVTYEVARTLHGPEAVEKQHKTQVKTTLHERSCRRALDNIALLTQPTVVQAEVIDPSPTGRKEDAVHPATIQRYLTRWSTWWHHDTGLGPKTNVVKWVKLAEDEQRFLRLAGFRTPALALMTLDGV